jgi:hypothetical protein
VLVAATGPVLVQVTVMSIARLPWAKATVAAAAGPALTQSTLYGAAGVQDSSSASPAGVQLARMLPPAEVNVSTCAGGAGAVVAGVPVASVDGGCVGFAGVVASLGAAGARPEVLTASAAGTAAAVADG